MVNCVALYVVIFASQWHTAGAWHRMFIDTHQNTNRTPEWQKQVIVYSGERAMAKKSDSYAEIVSENTTKENVHIPLINKRFAMDIRHQTINQQTWNVYGTRLIVFRLNWWYLETHWSQLTITHTMKCLDILDEKENRYNYGNKIQQVQYSQYYTQISQAPISWWNNSRMGSVKLLKHHSRVIIILNSISGWGVFY